MSITDNGWAGATYHNITWDHCHFLGSPRMDLECIQRADGGDRVTTGYHDIDLTDCVLEPSGSEAISYDAVGVGGRSTSSADASSRGRRNPARIRPGVEFNRAVGMQFIGNTVYRCRDAMINHSGVPGVAPDRLRNNIFDGTRSYMTPVPTAAPAIITSPA